MVGDIHMTREQEWAAIEAFRIAVTCNMRYYYWKIACWGTQYKTPYFFIVVNTPENAAPYLTVQRWGYMKRPANSPVAKWFRVSAKGDWQANMMETLRGVVKLWGNTINFTNDHALQQYVPPEIPRKPKRSASSQRLSSLSLPKHGTETLHQGQHVPYSTQKSPVQTHPSLF